MWNPVVSGVLKQESCAITSVFFRHSVIAISRTALATSAQKQRTCWSTLVIIYLFLQAFEHKLAVTKMLTVPSMNMRKMLYLQLKYQYFVNMKRWLQGRPYTDILLPVNLPSSSRGTSHCRHTHFPHVHIGNRQHLDQILNLLSTEHKEEH